MQKVKEYVFDHKHFKAHTLKAFFLGFVVGFFLAIGLSLLVQAKPAGATFTKPGCRWECVREIPVCVKWKWGKCIDWNKVCVDWKEVCPTPTPTAEPTPTVEPTPTEEPKRCQGEAYEGPYCGYSPEPWRPEEYKPPVCTVALPKQARIVSANHVSPTEVKVVWEALDENLTNFALTYGYELHSLNMGVPYIPKEARDFTIQNLPANSTVYVEVWSFNGNDCAVYSGRYLDR